MNRININRARLVQIQDGMATPTRSEATELARYALASLPPPDPSYEPKRDGYGRVVCSYCGRTDCTQASHP
jgi:hypothetical protein